MPLVQVLIRAGLLGLYVRIFYRKAQLRLLCRIAHKRISEVEDLANFVGLVFKEATPLFSAIRLIMLKDMGYATDTQGQRVVPLCWNAPIAIVVYMAELPYIGLGVELRGQSLCVRQMQGVRGAMPLRNLRDWPEILVKTCMAYAEDKGLKEVRVYKADQEIAKKQLKPIRTACAVAMIVQPKNSSSRKRNDTICGKSHQRRSSNTVAPFPLLQWFRLRTRHSAKRKRPIAGLRLSPKVL